MRVRTIHLLGLVCSGFALAASVACGSGAEPPTDDGLGLGRDAGNNSGAFGDRPDSSGSTSPSSSDASCAATNSAAKLDPLNMVILFDRSKSMEDDGKWTTVTHALSEFLNSASSDSLGISLGYFPLEYVCNRQQYLAPAIPLTVLPSGRATLVSNIKSQTPFVDTYGGTPMLPALEGSITYAKGLVSSDPTRRTVVILATDGYPEGCVTSAGGAPNTLSEIVSYVKSAAETDPKVKTFVIGVGSLLTSLDGIAAAGQTGAAFLVDTGSDTQEKFREALDTVRRQAAACDFAIPSTTAEIDFGNVNVIYREHPTEPDEFMGYVSSVADCTALPPGTKAWYYDDPSQPKRLNLCPSTCDVVQGAGAKDGTVNVQFGCKRIDVVVIPR